MKCLHTGTEICKNTTLHGNQWFRTTASASYLKMKVAGTAGAVVLIYKITSHYVPEDSNLHSCCHQNLRSHMYKITLRNMLDSFTSAI